jgi:hypothetical protein
MTMRVTRVCRLYNIPARAAQPARAGKPAVKARPFQKGVFDAGKTWVFESLLLRDPDDPLIPGTPVRRLPTFPLGEKAEVALDDEIARVFAELQSWSEAQFEARRDRREQASVRPHGRPRKTTAAEVSGP